MDDRVLDFVLHSLSLPEISKAVGVFISSKEEAITDVKESTGVSLGEARQKLGAACLKVAVPVGVLDGHAHMGIIKAVSPWRNEDVERGQPPRLQLGQTWIIMERGLGRLHREEDTWFTALAFIRGSPQTSTTWIFPALLSVFAMVGLLLSGRLGSVQDGCLTSQTHQGSTCSSSSCSTSISFCVKPVGFP